MQRLLGVIFLEVKEPVCEIDHLAPFDIEI
jgi:hypothetical protein